MQRIVFGFLMVAISCGSLFVTSCGEDTDDPVVVGSTQERAKPAEANLKMIREAVIKFHKAKGTNPLGVDDLDEFGAAQSDYASSDDYDSEFGYTFWGLVWNDDGTLKEGWFLATPKLETGALQVRMNGNTGEFDYAPQGERLGPAPGYENEPATNKPLEIQVD